MRPGASASVGGRGSLCPRRRSSEVARDRSPAGCPDPRGGRAHVRSRRLGAVVRLGRRGHQDRARGTGRRHARSGLAGLAMVPETSTPCWSIPNRGKQSSGSTWRHPTGWRSSTSWRPPADVFLTNKLPSVRTSSRSVSTRSGPTTPTSSTYGARSGRARPGCRQGLLRLAGLLGPVGEWRGGHESRVRPSASAAGPGLRRLDRAMTIAGGIMGALFHRERTGEATVVDVSLLGVGLWAMGQAVALSLVLDVPVEPPRRRPDRRVQSPLAQLRDRRTVGSWPSPASSRGKYWPPLCEAVGRPELATDPVRRPRLADGQQRRRRGDPDRGVRLGHVGGVARASRHLHRPVGGRAGHLEAVGRSPDRGQRLLQECHDGDGTPFRLVAAPVQFDEEPGAPTALPSSTSTATHPGRHRLRPMPSSTSRSAASSPDARQPTEPRHKPRQTGEETCRSLTHFATTASGPWWWGGHRHGGRRRPAGPGCRRRGGGHGLRRGHPGRRHRPSMSTWPTRASIDAAIAECGGPVDALLSCAGVADGTPGIERINFIGHRHMIDQHDGQRACWPGVRPSGSSPRPPAWAGRPTCPRSRSLATPDFDSAVAWVEENGKADYMSMKQAICAYVASQAFPLPQAGDPHQRHLPRPHRHAAGPGQQGDVAGLRCRLPGRGSASRPPRPWSRPTRWSSCAATPPSAITGITMITDAGYISSGITGSFPAATAAANFLLGRF